MKKIKQLITITLLAFILSLVFCGCNEDSACEGKVVSKRFMVAHSEVRLIPTTFYNGSSITIINMPYTYYFPDRWSVKIEWYENNNLCQRDIYVSKECFDVVKVGDWFVYDSNFCSYNEPCEITRE